MKKLMIILMIIVNIVLIILIVNFNNIYKNNYNKLSSMLDGIEYNDKVIELDMKYNNILDGISLIVGYDIADFSSFNNEVDKLDSKYEEINLEVGELNNKQEQLNKQKEVLKNTYNKLVEEERKKSTYIISGVKSINQYSLGYPTGCESAALTALLNFWGVNVSISDIVKALPKGDRPYYENGTLYGGNPYIEFVGHPSDRGSYGVYEKPILDVASSFKSGIINGTGMSLNSVLEKVREDRPVVVWVSMNMAMPYISTSWIHRASGSRISWMANEHALVVIGYNNSQVIVADSLNGSVRYYDKGVFENRYNTFGKRAIYY